MLLVSAVSVCFDFDMSAKGPGCVKTQGCRDSQGMIAATNPELAPVRSNALLDAEIKQLRSEVAELRAVFRTRPMSDKWPTPLRFRQRHV